MLSVDCLVHAVRGSIYPHTFPALSQHIGEPRLLELTHHFLYNQHQLHNHCPHSTSDGSISGSDDDDALARMKHVTASVDLSACPHICSTSVTWMWVPLRYTLCTGVGALVGDLPWIDPGLDLWILDWILDGLVHFGSSPVHWLAGFLSGQNHARLD